MEDPGESRRRWPLLLPVIVTLLLGVGLGGYVVVENQQQSERIADVDDLGADYLNEVATFRAQIFDALTAADKKEPSTLRAALKKTAADPPELPAADPETIELSATYQQAQQVAADLMAPYEDLAQELKKADGAFTFIEAANEVLKLDAEDYVDGFLLSESSQLRQSLIPAFVEARNDFAEVPVPKGAQKAADLTRAALQDVIDGASGLADSIDANRNDSFSYGEAHTAALKALGEFEATANGDYTEALNALNDLSGG